MDDSDDRAVLRHFKMVLWPRAYRMGDVELLDRMLHDSFEMIDAAGNTTTKADELAWISDNDWSPGRFDYSIERLSIYDNGVAVVSGEGVATSYSYRSSNVLIKESGYWRAISSHVSGFTTGSRSSA